MSLTPRDRVLAQIHHRETDHIPYTIRFEGDVAERLDAYYGGDAWRSWIDNAVRRLPEPELGAQRTGNRTYTDPYGSLKIFKPRYARLYQKAHNADKVVLTTCNHGCWM